MEKSLSFTTNLLTSTKAKSILGHDIIQALWSGYGHIYRIHLEESEWSSVVVKQIVFPLEHQHPRGWDTEVSHQRKTKSYAVENYWYQHYSSLCEASFRIPNCLDFIEINTTEKLLVLEDLNASGYTQRRSTLNVSEAKVVLSWLAQFHAKFMHYKPNGIWSIGTYWHLSTRHNEWNAMEEGKLKFEAQNLDNHLNNSKFQTIVHGDAKVANFCFSENMEQVAAVDFQYVGGGSGIKDVAYFLGSCMNEQECHQSETALLNHYFEQLNKGLKLYHPEINSSQVEHEYRNLYSIAWTDFTRFLKGWSPDHKKLNTYSEVQMNKAFNVLDK